MGAVGRWVRVHRVALLVGLSILVASGLIYHRFTAQPSSRYLLTVAIVDDHRLELDPYERLLGIDQAGYRGHIYTDKAPYQPFVAVVPYQLYRWAGGQPFPVIDGQPKFRVVGPRPFGLWWVTLWSATIPAIVLTLAVRKLLRPTHPELALPVAMALTFGTVILPFSAWLFGHVLAAMAIALAWRRLRPPDADHRAVLIGGLWLGFGIGTDFTVAVLALVLLLDLALRRRWLESVWLSIGTVVATIPLLAYNQLTFGGPFETAYQGHLANFHGSGALGVYNLQGPVLAEVRKALIGDRGLFVITPVVLAAVVGAVLLAWRPGPLRRDGVIGIVSLALLVVVSTGVDGYGGTSPGPRYLIPALPLLAGGLAEAWRRWPKPVAILAIIGVVTMGLASLTDPFVESGYTRSLKYWIDRAHGSQWATNILTGAPSTWVTLVVIVVALAAGVAALELDRKDRSQPIK